MSNDGGTIADGDESAEQAATVDIEHRRLRSAIEFAVAMGEELDKRKQQVAVPSALRDQFGKQRIPSGALGRLRRAIEADDTFRGAIGAGALPELVDEVGILWLRRPPGWTDDIRQVIAREAADAEEADLRTALRREEKRRHAAEQVAVRTRADLDARQSRIDDLAHEVDVLRADLAKSDEAQAELRAELVDVRNEIRHARDRERAAKARLDAELATGDAPPVPVVEAPVPVAPAIDVDELGSISEVARQLADRVAALVAPVGSGTETGASPRRERRRALQLPGGLIASSAQAAEFLLRSDAAVLVDGYNVAKLGWPNRNLEAQRTTLLDGLENAARRFGTDIAVIFDGSSVVGAHTTRRRLLRVSYSPDGVIADDVIRDEVRRLPTSRPVVVVTNDAEIVDDVRALGANVIPSNALLAVL